MFYRIVSRRLLIHNLSLEVRWWSQLGPELMCSRKCSCRYSDMNLGKGAAMSGRLSESTYEICYLTRSRQEKRRSGTNISTEWDYGFIPLSPQLLQYPRSLTRTANTKIFPITIRQRRFASSSFVYNSYTVCRHNIYVLSYILRHIISIRRCPTPGNFCNPWPPPLAAPQISRSQGPGGSFIEI